MPTANAEGGIGRVWDETCLYVGFRSVQGPSALAVGILRSENSTRPPQRSRFPRCGGNFTARLYGLFDTFVPSCVCGVNSTEPFMRVSVEVKLFCH